MSGRQLPSEDLEWVLSSELCLSLQKSQYSPHHPLYRCSVPVPKDMDGRRKPKQFWHFVVVRLKEGALSKVAGETHQ